MSTTQTEALSVEDTLKLALEAFEYEARAYAVHNEVQIPKTICEAITAIKEALAQPEQEPVAHSVVEPLRHDEYQRRVSVKWVNQPVAGPLYTAPPQRTWVGLTDEEFQLIYDMGRTPAGMMEMVEAKLKEKNT